MNFKSGLINCIGAIITIPLLILFIIFSSMYKNAFYIVFFTLFASFSLLYFLFSSLYSWISNENSQKVFKRLINICKILLITITYVILAFINIPVNLKWTFLGIIIFITILYVVFSSIWENIPETLFSILSVIIYLAFSIFFFILLFI